jgi:hypothetical protein
VIVKLYEKTYKLNNVHRARRKIKRKIRIINGNPANLTVAKHDSSRFLKDWPEENGCRPALFSAAGWSQTRVSLMYGA